MGQGHRDVKLEVKMEEVQGKDEKMEED